jgi:TM2 domain-containing membrane protein YozV
MDRKKGARMNLPGKNKGRNALPAVFVGRGMPGLGQIHNGELIKGISCFLILLSLYFIGAR